jgi:hypothetical protein
MLIFYENKWTRNVYCTRFYLCCYSHQRLINDTKTIRVVSLVVVVYN